MKQLERWRWVKDSDGKYLVSDKGTVISVPDNGRDGVTLGTNDSCGYVSVTINGRRTRVHRVVLEAFEPIHDGLPVVNHKDGDKKNNNLENLEWCTHSQNMQHAYDTGLRHSPVVKAYARKFTDDQVRSIRKDQRTARQIADDYGVSDVAICNIKNRKTYKGVEDVD